VADEYGRQVSVEGGDIAIAHGKVVSGGQPLSEDISLEKDAEDGQRTTLHPLFRKNTALPVESEVTFQANRTLVKVSKDDIRVRVLEGPNDSSPEACVCIGELRLAGQDLRGTLYRGADIELTARKNENNQVHIGVHLPTIDQDFTEVFTGTDPDVRVDNLHQEAAQLQSEVDEALGEAEETEDYERARQLKDMQRQAESLQATVSNISRDDATDAHLRADSEKQRLAAEVSRITADKHLRAARQEYTEMLSDTADLVEQHGNDDDGARLKELQQTSTSSPIQTAKRKSSLRPAGSHRFTGVFRCDARRFWKAFSLMRAIEQAV
jgi:hypothetical protein